MSARRRGGEDESGRRRAASVLLLAVIGVLALGWWLRTDRRPPEDVTVLELGPPEGSPKPPPEHEPASSPPSEGSRTPAEPQRSPMATPQPQPAGTVAPSPPTPAHAPPSPLDSLARRATRDAQRLRNAGGAWTLQLMVACQEDNARRIAGLAPDPDRLYVLSVRLDGRNCYRLCWGVYPSDAAARAEAPRARDAFGGALREMPRPRPVSELID